MGNKTRARYNRNAFIYNLMEFPVERSRFSAWRRRLMERVSGGEVLEVGVGTGKNIPYYPSGAMVTAVDFSEKMLSQAVRKAKRGEGRVSLAQMDAENLGFKAGTFDQAVTAFVFCSVPDPVAGLEEIRRALKPGGRIVMLEHMLPANRWLRRLFNLLNPLVVRAVGANINRETVRNVERAGFRIERVEDLLADVVRIIVASA